MTPQQMQMLYSQMAQRAIAPQMARMQPLAAQAMPRAPVARQAVAPRQQQVQRQQQWGIGRGTRGPALSPDAVAAQREDERRRAAEKAAQRQLELSRPRSYATDASAPSQWSLMDFMSGRMIPVSGPTQDWNGPNGTSRNFWQWGQGEDGKAEVWWNPEFAPKELRYSYERVRPDNWEAILNTNAPVVDRSWMTPADLAAEGSYAAAMTQRNATPYTT